MAAAARPSADATTLRTFIFFLFSNLLQVSVSLAPRHPQVLPSRPAISPARPAEVNPRYFPQHGHHSDGHVTVGNQPYTAGVFKRV